MAENRVVAQNRVAALDHVVDADQRDRGEHGGDDDPAPAAEGQGGDDSEHA